MINPMSVKEFLYEMSFAKVKNAINNKGADSKNLEYSIRETKGLLEDVVNWLESMTTGDKYFFVDNIKEIVEASGYENISKENVDDIIKTFRKRIIQLEDLNENPEEFYKKEDAKELSSFCVNMEKLYSKELQFFKSEEN